MPLFERAIDYELGLTDGKEIFESIFAIGLELLFRNIMSHFFQGNI